MATIRELERWRHDNPLSSWEQLNRNLADLERILKVKDSLTEGLSQIEVSGGSPSPGDVLRWDGSQWAPWSPKYMTAKLMGNQTSNLAVGNHVEFNSIRADSGHISLSTGAGQAQGIFTVPKGDWQVALVVNANYNGALGLIGIDLVEDPGGTVLGAARARDRSYSAADNESRAPVSSQVISLASATDVKAEIAQSAIVNAIQSATHITFMALA